MISRRQLMRTVAVGLPTAVLGGTVSQMSAAHAHSRTKSNTAEVREPQSCAPGSGKIIQWGPASAPAVPAAGLSGVTAVSTGACANLYNLMLKDGRVTTWGNFNLNDTNQQRLSRVPVAATKDVTAIATAGTYSFALRDGGVIVWGGTHDGQLSLPETAKSGVTAIAGANGGSSYGLFLKDGGVIQWNGYVALPDEAKEGIVAISARQHALALREDGRVITWGPNLPANLAVPAEAQSGVTAISAGGGFSLALKNGAVIAWGDNKYGQLEVPYEAQSDVVAISAGNLASMALTASGKIVTWAYNFYGQLDIPEEAQCGASAISCGYVCMVLL
ncbi:RCC1 domain-containing protein [Nonomuraea sp. NPDC050451]|uniref:RCC1 domain-containing protein n=1 Tax=Nonomuraea sp. NPDC050451 TaxID=3364364 RepID=UPI0037B6D570